MKGRRHCLGGTEITELGSKISYAIIFLTLALFGASAASAAFGGGSQKEASLGVSSSASAEAKGSLEAHIRELSVFNGLTASQIDETGVDNDGEASIMSKLPIFNHIEQFKRNFRPDGGVGLVREQRRQISGCFRKNKSGVDPPRREKLE